MAKDKMPWTKCECFRIVYFLITFVARQNDAKMGSQQSRIPTQETHRNEAFCSMLLTLFWKQFHCFWTPYNHLFYHFNKNKTVCHIWLRIVAIFRNFQFQKYNIYFDANVYFNTYACNHHVYVQCCTLCGPEVVSPASGGALFVRIKCIIHFLTK